MSGFINLGLMVEPTIESPNSKYQLPNSNFSDTGMDMIPSETQPFTMLARLKGSRSLDSTAIDVMMSAVTLYSRSLATALSVSIDGFGEISKLLEQLKDRQLITDTEWNRLTVVQMALDGLDIGVNEYGANVTTEDVDYASEFCETIKRAYSRLDTNEHPINQTWSLLGRSHTGSSGVKPADSYSSTVNRTVSIPAGETATFMWQVTST